jgi:hypothetical protein
MTVRLSHSALFVLTNHEPDPAYGDLNLIVRRPHHLEENLMLTGL